MSSAVATPFICYDPSDLNVRVGPDFYAALGVDAPAIEKRKMYLPWEAGKPPDFVLEVGSESTARHDVTGKRDTYARVGVAEYWRFDRSGGELYGEPLAGDFLEGGTYRPAKLTTEPDGVPQGIQPGLAPKPLLAGRRWWRRRWVVMEYLPSTTRLPGSTCATCAANAPHAKLQRPE